MCARPDAVGVEAFCAPVELERDAVRDAPAVPELRERDVVARRDPEQRRALASTCAAPAPRLDAERRRRPATSPPRRPPPASAAPGRRRAPRPRASVTSGAPSVRSPLEQRPRRAIGHAAGARGRRQRAAARDRAEQRAAAAHRCARSPRARLRSRHASVGEDASYRQILAYWPARRPL